MSRQQFTSRNDKGQILTFQKSGSTASFDPIVTFSTGSRRVSWKLNNGSETIQTAGNSITYTGFTSDIGIRDIQMRGNSFRGITQLSLDNENLYGHIDLSKLNNNWGTNGTLALYTNPKLTGITNPSITSGQLSNYQVFSTGIVGNLDMTPITVNIATFLLNNNPTLTGITHNTTSTVTGQYVAHNSNLTGNLNLPFTGLVGNFQVYSNPNLTGITHSPSSNNFTVYYANNCKLTGNLDLTPLSRLGGDFRAQSNINLTGITHSPSPNNFTFYYANNCNLTGNLDLTPLSGLGGDFNVNDNINLTGITHSLSSQNFTQYKAKDCELTGTLDIRNLTKLGASTTESTGMLRLDGNGNLTNVLLPSSIQYFKNESNGLGSRAFSLYGCNLDYIDFTSLSGATLVSGTTQGRAGIDLQSNNMSTTDVNHILVDFSGNATYNQTGWSNINLNISGTNGAPDSSSGGYDGLSAISFLTGSPYNWTITYA